MSFSDNEKLLKAILNNSTFDIANFEPSSRIEFLLKVQNGGSGEGGGLTESEVRALIEEYIKDVPVNEEEVKALIEEYLKDIPSTEVKVDNVSIKFNEEGELTLNKVYLDYLQEVTYVKPTIASFTVSGLASNYIVGETISATEFKHYETSIDNINGNLTFTITGGYSENITPSASSTTITLATMFSKTFDTHGQSVTFTLSGKDVKGNTISKTASKTAYYPFYHGVSVNESYDETLAKGLTRKIGNTPGTYTYELSENAFIYWFSTTSINNIKDTNGNTIDYVKLDDISMPVITDGANVTYKVYRTTEQLVPGSWKFTLS